MATKIDNDARKVESPLEARRARARQQANASASKVPQAPQATRPAATQSSQVSISERARNLARTEQAQRSNEAAQARQTSDTYERLQATARRANAERQTEVKRAE